MRSSVKFRSKRHEGSDGKEKGVIFPVASTVAALLATALLQMSSYMQIACTSMKSYKQYQVSACQQH